MSTNIRQRLTRIFHRDYRQAKSMAHTVLLALIIAMSNVGVHTAQAVIPPGQVGAGFTVTAADLAFILQQIKIAEYHAANTTSTTGLCGALVGIKPNQIANPLLSFGLRTVDGTCNNLQADQQKYGAADQVFPRLTTPVFKPAEDSTVPGIGPVGPPGLTNYVQKSGSVVDSQPRVISNLIVDQTSTNPAAVWVAGHPARTQANPDVAVPCDTDPGSNPPVDIVPLQPVDCVPAHKTLFIPSVTTDVGLSPPFNSLFTIFGQFFDHGLDKITNGGNGVVFIPLKADDPLVVAGPDGIPGNGDEVPPTKQFMMLTRGSIVPGTDHDAMNTDTPFVDQSQTYTSHGSHQVFLREYTSTTPGSGPFSTGKFLSESDGGMAKWSTIKQHAAEKLGFMLTDADVTNIPEVLTDPYGNFIPGNNGFPQYVTASGLVEGNPANGGVPVPANVNRINTAFLNDIAHSADPGSIVSPKVPDANLDTGGSLDPVATGEYDNELLDLHFICGDGRCNENIGLTAIHQVFHMEHDRLIDDITATLNANPSLKAAYEAIKLTPDTLATPGEKTFRVGERLFQAARFVTEMQYQHLVFEEFARKVQPLINPFEPFAFNQTDLNSAISAEFAHAVYRFGHSMLTETLPRINADGTHNDIGLLEGFLNPAAFHDGGTAGILETPEATGAIIMGLSDQVGNEIDEFVTETLRNNLLGLPLDLPSINMARARSEGIPSLNNVRRQILAATNDGQMTPYANWIDFREGLKHPESLVNFIAAYGKHPSIVGATTLVAKRAAAQVLVDSTDTDSVAFMFSTGAWANTETGLNDIDLWVGGLAEKTNLFGGLLGSTFNYVFEKQMTDLQNGDRFYYLARTPGMNLRTQLEGNSFSELVMRNTPSHTLKADPFATADCKFELANLEGTVAGFVAHGSTVTDDPASECNETALLIRMPDGTIRYRATNSEDPAGINGQAVYNGTDFADIFYGGNDNDTFWGGLGNDRIEGGGGDDVVLGGEGDDIITDFAGADFLKGGPGNDAIDGGIGDDIIIAGDGKDFTNGGANINETFLGEGDDFAIAGQGTDAVFGDSGDDWMEGGDQPDLLIGDSSSLFFDDHNKPGHDIIIGQGGDDDYDMEGGDDIGVAGPGVEKVAGGAGFDWEIGLDDPQPQDADLDLKIVNVLPAFEARDRYNEVEALSGWKFNDTLRGDSLIPSQLTGGAAGGGSIGCDALDADGVERIAGLELLITPAMRVVDPTSIIGSTSTSYCGLEGLVWGEGNILLGGEGSDMLEGRGANDILDGDRYMNVRLSVRSNPANPSTESGSTDLMENAAITGNFGLGTTGMTLQQAVFAGLVNPGNIVAVREILTPPVGSADCGAASSANCDTAVFSGSAAEYTFINSGNNVTVIDSGPAAGAVNRNNDGSDTLWNIEQLSFCDSPGAVRGTCDVPRTLVSVSSLVFSNPLPIASVTGSRVFGLVPVATASQQVVTLKNTGTANLVVSSMTTTGIDATSFSATTCNTLAPGGDCVITVTFTPTTSGDKSATLVINHNAVTATSTVDLSGTGVGNAPVAAVSLTSISFGSVNAGNVSGSQSITVKNIGTADLVVTGVTVTGADAAAFSVLADTCGTVAQAGTCSITVTFLPTSTGTKNAALVITHNSVGSTTSIPLAGVGISTGTTAGTGTVVTGTVLGTGTVTTPGTAPGTQPNNAKKLVMPTSLDFGKLKVNVNHTVTVTVTNHQRVELPVTFVNTLGKVFTVTRGNCPISLSVGRSCKLRVTFHPNVPGKTYSGTLKLWGNLSKQPMTMSLTGKGKR